ncbi:hypothetical protein TNCV_2816871 [Trichonephila clavipes]|nr:hypothetical protein TNCV_2816871 [Trichonephila clavipes]
MFVDLQRTTPWVRLSPQPLSLVSPQIYHWSECPTDSATLSLRGHLNSFLFIFSSAATPATSFACVQRRTPGVKEEYAVSFEECDDPSGHSAHPRASKLTSGLMQAVPDACWNSWSMWAIDLGVVFLISLGIPFRFHSLNHVSTVDFAMFTSLDMSLKNLPFLRYTTFTPFSKSDRSEFRGILHAANTNAVSYSIFKYRRRDVDQGRRYPNLYGCPDTY